MQESFIIRQVKFTVTDRNQFLISLREIGKKWNVSIICFNADLMAGKKHVFTAMKHALHSFKNGELISRSLEVEALLYAAGTRQTSLIGPFGIHEGDNRCYLCIVPPSEKALIEIYDKMKPADNEDWELLDPIKKRSLIKFFEITDAELNVVGDDRINELVCERSALLAINR